MLNSTMARGPKLTTAADKNTYAGSVLTPFIRYRKRWFQNKYNKRSNQVCTTQRLEKCRKKTVFTHLKSIHVNDVASCQFVKWHDTKTHAFFGFWSHMISGLCSLTLSIHYIFSAALEFFSAYTQHAILGPLHMSSVTEMKLVSVHMVTFSPLSEMKNLKKWWRDHSGVKSNEQDWREFLDFLCLNNLKFLLTLR